MTRAASIKDLPDEVLEAVFDHLKLQERQRTIPFVCKNWREVVHGANLLISVSIETDCSDMPGEDCVSAVQSLCTWLVERAAWHVRYLDLAVSLPMPDDREDFFEVGLNEEHWTACRGMLQEALAACDEVTELELALNFSFNLNSLISGMPDLDSLSAAAVGNNAIVIEEPFTQQLVHLQFPAVKCLEFEEAATLPLSLTSLAISGDFQEIFDFQGQGGHKLMPPQVGMLTRLKKLSVDGCFYGWDECEPLQHMRSTLTQLRWTSPGVPSNLSCLTALRSLTLGDPQVDPLEGEDIDRLEQALPEMASLTQLVMNETTSLPAALTVLQQLSNLCIFYVAEGARLPAGGWMRSVRRLAANTTLLAASLPNLGAADGLEDVGVFVYEDELDIEANLQKIMAWAGQKPRLQRLLIDYESEAAAAAAAPLPPRPEFEHGHDFVHATLFPSDTPDEEYYTEC